MSGQSTPNLYNDSSLLLRTRKSDRDLVDYDVKEDKKPAYEVIEMGEVAKWNPNAKQNKRKWTLLQHKPYLTLALCMLIFLGFIVNTRFQRKIPNRHQLFFNGTTYFDTTVILLSLDGFRNDYLDRKVTPNIENIGKRGISAEYMNPSFPSITFPNHWTLVTGLYPEAHGIVANEFYDPALGQDFIHKNESISSDPKWWKGEPIWITSKKQGKKSAVIMWPGSNVKIDSLSPDYYQPYSREITAQDKMDTVLNWLDLPMDERPQSISVYIPQIDQKGHGGGPNGGQLNSVLTDMDNAIGYLLKGLKQRNLDSHVHVVVVSDHGMAPSDPSRYIFYDKILSDESQSYLRPREAWPLLGLRPRDDAPEHIIDQIYHELQTYTETHDDVHFTFYRREEMPSRFHYNATERIAPIVIIPDVGYAIIRSTDKKAPKGIHGYDNMAPEMRAIFAATGPKISQHYGKGTRLVPFFNTEVYAFLTTLLDLVPAPNNATLNGILK